MVPLTGQSLQPEGGPGGKLVNSDAALCVHVQTGNSGCDTRSMLKIANLAPQCTNEAAIRTFWQPNLTTYSQTVSHNFHQQPSAKTPTTWNAQGRIQGNMLGLGKEGMQWTARRTQKYVQ